ncbi:hypothetical protein P171DRAFT_497753 [Karstenula rhodostoma CBS 690.94]|uniref:SnoaL-like domain-containing protein n=1 Tax=Karstenula rhodostoma CBS 690.94 TaxID=1392251 RepID=A0A9P4PED4_9PLEO|nr:hypothetical protein P171DRAFT_497753 [Karstenula rhodostoma CBS 690.94]
MKLASIGVTALFTLASADTILDNLARDVSRVESIREVKDVQRSFAHLAQFGRFHDATTLFTTNATFIWGNVTTTGRSAIENFLNTHTGDMNGRESGSLNTLVIENPVVSLSVDGQSAKARWNGLRFAGDGKGGSWIEGGIYENQYVRAETGWRIALLHYHALYEGTYEDGWRNVGGRGIPVIPYHFTPEGSGVPIPPPVGDASPTNASLSNLELRIKRLNDEDEVRNLMHAHGYYVDRRMWTDVVELHTNKTKVTITGQGTYNGLDGARQALERMGPEGLTTGVNNDHPIFDTLVQVNPDGQRAIARGIEIAMRGDANSKTASWEFNVFRNNFIKENGIWKVKVVETTPLIVADYYKGWGNSGTNTPTGYLPPFLNVGSFREAGLPSSNGTSNATYEDVQRRLRRSAAYDGTENQSHAYGHIIDDIDCARMGALFATRAHKASPFAGFFITPQRITDACLASYGTNRSTLPSSVFFHWRPQPVILASHDGRSATLRARLLQPSTSVAKAGSFNSAMYHDQVVLENGRWRLWSVTIDEFYWQSSSWAAGWANPRPRNASQPDPAPAGWIKKFPPDVTIAEVGEREAGFRGGAGKFVEWPEIQRMWFGYRNLVSGRVPSGDKVGFWEGCVPCRVRPEWALEANGWQQPGAGPGGNGTVRAR